MPQPHAQPAGGHELGLAVDAAAMRLVEEGAAFHRPVRLVHDQAQGLCGREAPAGLAAVAHDPFDQLADPDRPLRLHAQQLHALQGDDEQEQEAGTGDHGASTSRRR